MSSFFKLGLRVEDRAFYGRGTVVTAGLRLVRGDREIEAACVLLDEIIVEHIDDPLLAKLTEKTETTVDNILITKENFMTGTWSILPDYEQSEWDAEMIRESMENAVKEKEAGNEG